MPDIPITFVQEHCYSCSMVFMVTSDFQKKRVADKQNLFCPNGHSMLYVGKTKEQILREELSAKNVELGRISTELAALKNKTKRKPRKNKTT